ncbi:MAG: ribosomal protein S18-alanine N-acetyltransferase [Clostridia bacterium]|nr:ribosomal protein S18-alanine N-acetyltransferase [Clostridia bacterium]
MIIEKVTSSDIAEIAELERKYIYHPYSVAVIEGMLSNPSCLALKVSENGLVAAYVSGELVIDEFNINNVVVDKQFRRKGYAEALMREIISRCQAANAKKIYLEVASDNEPAKNLYYKLGFSLVYERKRYYGEQSALVLIKSM